ncbi:MAG TPA: peptide deformylase, partial [Clostridiaceae bacterium]|nr:peptide deformylase [Clostridiaceae bacterium]
MAVKRILTFGEKTLERVSRKVEKIDSETLELIRDMKDTLTAAPGIGLAAPQIG